MGDGGLYCSEAECARRAGFGLSRWRKLAKSFERLGMPRKDAITGRRYWPAVVAFLDRHNGMAEGPAGRAVEQLQPDGKENPDAWKAQGRGRNRNGAAATR